MVVKLKRGLILKLRLLISMKLLLKQMTLLFGLCPEVLMFLMKCGVVAGVFGGVMGLSAKLLSDLLTLIMNQ